MIWRILLTGALIGVWYWAEVATATIAAPALNDISVRQFDSADGWRLAAGSQSLMALVHRFGGLALALVVFLIWLRPLKDGWAWLGTERKPPRNMTLWALAILSGVVVVIGAASPAFAYRYKTDWAEYYNAAPDETVFLIPMLGDKDKQAIKKDEAFLTANKVSAQYVLVTHGTLPQTGTIMNDTVNIAQVVVVKRRPVAREWTNRVDTGTSAADQSFTCETAQSHNVRTGLTAAFMIEEGNAAKYLYFAGADPSKKLPTSQTGGESDKDQTFVSAVAATSLSDFVDVFARRIIQTELCKAVGSRTTDKVIEEKAKIIDEVNTAASAKLKAMGVTVSALGYAGAFELDPKIQSAIDDVYIAGKRKLAADAVKDALPVMEAQARVEALLAFSEALKGGKLPNLPSFVGAIPPEVLEAAKHYATSATVLGVPAAK